METTYLHNHNELGALTRSKFNTEAIKKMNFPASTFVLEIFRKLFPAPPGRGGGTYISANITRHTLIV